MSQAGSQGRDAPRWSAGGQPEVEGRPPASMAGLPASSAIVLVGPPLPASEPSCGLTPVRSVGFDSPQEVSVARLYPAVSCSGVAQSGVEPFVAKIVPVAVV